MISWLKKHFIPHVGNDHRPHILRTNSIRNIVFLIIFLEVFTFLIPTLSKINMNGGLASVLPSILSDLTNNERQDQKLNTLAVNPVLNKAAEMKAKDMATLGYFAHTSPEGKTPWYWLAQVGYKYQYAGENLAVDFSDSKDVTNAWMASPTHKANIVKENYTEVGTGVATGMYQGKETIFVAQVYANPLPTVKEEIKIAKVEPEIKNTETIPVTTIDQTPVNVLGAETTSSITPTFWQKMLASPRNNTNAIFLIIFGIILLSLILNIVIKIKHYHGDLITNGLITLAIIMAVLIANYYLTHRNMVVTQSVDYSVLGK